MPAACAASIVEVTADAGSRRHLRTLYPDENIEVSARGNTLVLAGQVSSALVARRARELAEGTGASVIDNLETPAPTQILLQVRIAEVSQTALKRLGNQVIDVLNPHRLDSDGDWRGATDSDGVIQLSLINSDAHLRAVIRALQETGDFKSLAEPNLLALDGQEASFLAGGEFPYPTVQGGQRSDAITIEWREFGVQLTFTPTVTNVGNINLTIAPEYRPSTSPGPDDRRVPDPGSPHPARPHAGRAAGGTAPGHRRPDGSVDPGDRSKAAVPGRHPDPGRSLPLEVRAPGGHRAPGHREPTDRRADGPPPAIPTGEPETWEWDRRLAPPPADLPDVPPGVDRKPT
jgi:hypothetical protein